MVAATCDSPAPRIRHRCKGMTPQQRREFFSDGGEGRELYPAHLCDQQLRMLDERESRRQSRKSRQKKDELDLTPEQLHSLCVKLEQITPSEPWARDIRAKIVAKKIPNKRDIGKELDRQKVFPPGGSQETLMKRCPTCGERWHPPQYLLRRPTGEVRQCTECFENARAPIDYEDRRRSSGGDEPIRTHSLAVGADGGYEAVELVTAVLDGTAELEGGATTSSPIAVAAGELKRLNAIIEESKLPPEDDESLIKETIAECEKLGIKWSPSKRA